MDPDTDRLDVVGGLAGRILARHGWPGRLVLTGDRSAALDGAAFTLVQLRVGGQAARLVDETLPHRFGAIGQETTGPGGFAKALRTVPLVLDIAAESAAPRRAGLVAARLHEPGRDRHPGAAPTRGIARSGCATSRSASSGSSREHFGVAPRSASGWTTSGSTTSRGSGAVHVDGVDRLPALLDGGRPDRHGRRAVPARARSGAAGDPLVLPPLLLRDGRGARDAAGRPQPRPRRDGDRARSCSSSTATRRSTASPSCSSAAAAPGTARRRPRSSSRSTRATARSTSSTSATTARSPTSRTTPWWSCAATDRPRRRARHPDRAAAPTRSWGSSST